jgi:hypothetical protein
MNRRYDRRLRALETQRRDVQAFVAAEQAAQKPVSTKCWSHPCADGTRVTMCWTPAMGSWEIFVTLLDGIEDAAADRDELWFKRLMARYEVAIQHAIRKEQG